MNRPLPDFSSLRPAGSKRSSKRDRILNIFLRQEGHLSADDLVRSRPPARIRGIGRATVYRTLQWMVNAGVARKVGLRRGAVALRAVLPASAPLSPRLQRLPPLVRVPELRHRVAGRGNRARRASSRRSRPCCRSSAPATSAAPARRRRRWTARTTELVFARDALRIAIATERSGLEFYTARRAHHAGRARPRACSRQLAAEEREHLGTLQKRYQELLSAGSAPRSRGRRSCSSRARPTGLFAEGAEQLRARRRRSAGAAHRHPLRARLAPLLQALRRAVRGFRRQADLPGVRRRRSARISIC